jgi:phosphoserine phosphatase RsbU/P
MVTGSHPNVLLFGAALARSREVHSLLTARGMPVQFIDYERESDAELLRAADLLVCVLDHANRAAGTPRVRALLDCAQESKIPALVWGAADGDAFPDGQLIDCLPPDACLEEVIGRLTALARYAPAMKQMEHELQRLQRLGKNLNRYFEEIDQEMRLAGRLQRDFLPQTYPARGRLSFHQTFRPAVWVSGDIFDVFEIDAGHVAMFIADAMGHGTAAALMTMFLRRALIPTRKTESGVEIVPPTEVLRELHDGLARQNLPHAQFVTAAYGVFDAATLDFRLARGGHPYPLHVRADGSIEELRCEGGLLGVAGLEPEFGEYRGRLSPGEKVIFYTDGLEKLFLQDRDGGTEQAEFTERLRDWAHRDAKGFIAGLNDHLDNEEGSLNPEDDVTVVIAEASQA